MIKKPTKGFTLIELAIVIVIVAILASVAVPRFTQVTASAQGAVAQDLLAQVTSAASIWTAENQANPNGFNQFVNAGALQPGQTLSLANVGNQSGAPCVVTGPTIVCPGGQGGRFSDLGNVTIAFNAGPGTFTLDCAPPALLQPGRTWNRQACRYNAAAAAPAG
jgi:prepilin-type N-terminal cleavage/methylation domain-containing protein